jgi:hypothetical protein
VVGGDPADNLSVLDFSTAMLKTANDWRSGESKSASMSFVRCLRRAPRAKSGTAGVIRAARLALEFLGTDETIGGRGSEEAADTSPAIALRNF